MKFIKNLKIQNIEDLNIEDKELRDENDLEKIKATLFQLIKWKNCPY